jgi:hypothetical protein
MTDFGTKRTSRDGLPHVRFGGRSGRAWDAWLPPHDRLIGIRDFRHARYPAEGAELLVLLGLMGVALDMLTQYLRRKIVFWKVET